MPAANLLTDDGHLAVSVDSDTQTLKVGAQSFSTMAGGASDNTRYCNVHVALLFALAIGFIVLMRKSGIHALALEG